MASKWIAFKLLNSLFAFAAVLCAAESTTVASTGPSPRPAPEVLAPGEPAKLLTEYKRAQRSETRALEHRQRAELRELKSSQKAQGKDWQTKERAERHKYFSEHTGGPDRRAYIQSYLERSKTFASLQKDEIQQKMLEQERQRTALKERHEQSAQAFEAKLKEGVRPPRELWP